MPFAIVGGYAVAVHGIARGTFDVDLITEISEANLLRIEEALAQLHLQSSLPITARDLAANLQNYIQQRNLIAWNFINPAKMRESLDIIVTEDIRDFEIQEVPSDFGPIPTLTIEGLIRMKSKANREQDQKDIAALKALRERKP